MDTEKIYSHSSNDTFELGQRIAEEFKRGDVVALRGELGAGKTVLIKGVAQGLGYTEIVNSPTFVLMQLYELPEEKRGISYICHIDAYRVYSSEEIKNAGIEEYLGREDTLTVIEWPERISDILPSDITYIDISLSGEESREVIIKRPEK